MPTDENPADIATRKFTTSDLCTSMWLRGPDFLHTIKLDDANEHYPLIDAESDQELKKEVVTVKTIGQMDVNHLKTVPCCGRIHRRQAQSEDHHLVHPIIVPKGHHIAVLLKRHDHSVIHQQGRQMTEGAIRSAGYWVINCNRMVSSEIHHCVTH